MATVYVRSTDGSDADNGSTWALADATLTASVVAAGAGGRSYVSQVHAETQASAMTIAAPGTVGSPTEIVCGNDAAEPPTAVATTATVTTTGANSISISGALYCYGLTFNVGTGSTSASFNFNSGSTSLKQVFEQCVFNIVNTGTAANINATNDTANIVQVTELLNCNISFGHANCRLRISHGQLNWFGGVLNAGVALPTTLLNFAFATNYRGGRALIVGVDLSQLGSGKSLVDASSMNSINSAEFIDCKLGASVAVITGSFAAPGPFVQLVNCDSGDTHYAYYYQDYMGTITSDVAVVRTGGANDGTQQFSRKFVSSANTKFHSPLRGPWFYYWLNTPGAATVAIETVTDNVTLTDAECWVEVESLTNSGFPYGSFARDRAADILATPASQTSSSETWTGAPGTPVKQTMSKAITTAESGWVRARLCLAKASTTLYACPKVG